MAYYIQPNPINVDLADTDDDSVFQDQTLGGAGDFTLNGADVVSGEWITPDGFAHQLVLTCAADESARTVTVTGFYDLERHHPASITIAGVNATTAESTAYLAIITSVALDGATSGNIKLGFVDEAVAIMPLDPATDPSTIEYVVTGTISFDIEGTTTPIHKRNARHPFSLTNAFEDWNWVANSSALSSSGNLTLNSPVQAIRLKVNSYSSGAAVVLTAIQPVS